MDSLVTLFALASVLGMTTVYPCLTHTDLTINPQTIEHQKTCAQLNYDDIKKEDIFFNSNDRVYELENGELCRGKPLLFS